MQKRLFVSDCPWEHKQKEKLSKHKRYLLNEFKAGYIQQLLYLVRYILTAANV